MAAHTSATRRGELNERRRLLGWRGAAERAGNENGRVERSGGWSVEPDPGGNRGEQCRTRGQIARWREPLLLIGRTPDEIDGSSRIGFVVVGTGEASGCGGKAWEAPTGRHAGGALAAARARHRDTGDGRKGQADDNERGESRQRQTHGLCRFLQR